MQPSRRLLPPLLMASLSVIVIYLPSLHAVSSQEQVMRLTSDAERGSLSAEIELGARYMTGNGVPRDLSAAAHWYEKAAQRGEPNAQNQIGYFYQSGIGVPKDLGRAMHWYQLSAASGDPSAILNIGVLYLLGVGVKKDASYAASLFEKAVRKGNGTAAAYLGDIYYFGMLGPVDLDSAEKWFDTGSRMHDPIATYDLGSLFSVDSRHPHDPHKAVLLMRRASADGYVPAMHALALLLINHPQEEQTSGEVRSLLETAASAGEWKSSVLLGILARDGKQEPVDKRAADYHFHVALLQGGKLAQELVMHDIAKLDALLDPAQRDKLRAEAQVWYAQHSQTKKFILKDSGSQKLFPLPDETDAMHDASLSGQTTRSTTKEAPCIGES